MNFLFPWSRRHRPVHPSHRASSASRPSELGGKLLGIAVGGLLLLGASACSHSFDATAPGFSGLYSGSSAATGSVELNLINDDLFAWGTGSADGRAFALAVLGPWAGPAVIVFEGASPTGGHLEPSPAGLDLRLPGASETLALERTGDAAGASGGSYSGLWRGSGLRLRLHQRGDLVAGQGRLEGQPAAVACASPSGAGGSSELRCGALLPDSSLLRLTVERRSDRELRVRGLGGSVDLQRSGR